MQPCFDDNKSVYSPESRNVAEIVPNNVDMTMDTIEKEITEILTEYPEFMEDLNKNLN